MITLTTEQAQQIEEVLEELCGSIDFYNKYGPDWTHKDGTESFNVSVLLDRADDISKAIIALREALAEQERKAKYDERFERLEKFEKQAEQEPVAWMEDSIELYVSEKPSSTFTIPLYAAPVRTKDMTDDDKANLVMEHLGFCSLTGGKMSIYEAFLLGVEKGIAADRELNK